ncbi:MAG: 50S ribosomal protein L23 [Bacilli bacterium]|jgi:large subunit ribosomal protein L23|nr:50S ribosomal protein L23 [Bacilli bacterium]
MKKNYDIIVRPLITEKTTKLIEENKYTFEVKQGSNKVEVAKAVEELWQVKVVAVNMINTQRKTRRVGKYEGLRPAVQKAVVTLAKGDKLDVFEL